MSTPYDNLAKRDLKNGPNGTQVCGVNCSSGPQSNFIETSLSEMYSVSSVAVHPLLASNLENITETRLSGSVAGANQVWRI